MPRNNLPMPRPITRRSFAIAGLAACASGSALGQNEPRDANVVFPFGTRVYREPSLPLDQIRADLPLLKRLGFTMIKIQQSWSIIELRFDPIVNSGRARQCIQLPASKVPGTRAAAGAELPVAGQSSSARPNPGADRSAAPHSPAGRWWWRRRRLQRSHRDHVRDREGCVVASRASPAALHLVVLGHPSQRRIEDAVADREILRPRFDDATRPVVLAIRIAGEELELPPWSRYPR